ncbi:Cell division protein SepF [Corynebacterium ciconiae DSM 44920]|uniref:cell division protein SepF n=1 Tax=Corynebacterium ciconiae TaxID=227319 RepID=UPI00036941F7|nr:cell division protein SepF [Corynebacterium ciconiae]WKD60790.1 Cell division protein SepF [Corynebacterium ciconiae DSM 44920]
MSSLNKFKEYFGLGPYTEDMDDAYYGDEAGYQERGYEERSYGEDRYAERYGRRYEEPSREAESYYERDRDRSYACAIVPVDISSYTEAARIGEPFRDGDAVVFDISRMNSDDAHRVVDFAAGLGFALRGTMKKVAPRVFALIPDGAHVSTAQLERTARV